MKIKFNSKLIKEPKIRMVVVAGIAAFVLCFAAGSIYRASSDESRHPIATSAEDSSKSADNKSQRISDVDDQDIDFNQFFDEVEQDYYEENSDTNSQDQSAPLSAETFQFNNTSGYTNIHCSQISFNCTAHDSNGNYVNIHCYQYSNTCTALGSDGSSATSHCYSYSNTCNTYGSDGSYSNTHCYTYSNSCSTYDSDGSYSRTHCYTYSNSCSTYGSDGSYSTTHCYSYSNTCSTYEF